MEKLNELISKCKNSVSIDINDHRDCFFSVGQYLRNHCVENEVLEKMIELDTMIIIQFYPKNSVGSYFVYHFDLESAINECLEIINQDGN